MRDNPPNALGDAGIPSLRPTPQPPPKLLRTLQGCSGKAWCSHGPGHAS